MIFDIIEQPCIKLHYNFKNIKANMLDTYCDESLVETVEAQIPDEPPIGKRWNKPKVKVRDHHKWSAAHHPRRENDTKGLMKLSVKRQCLLFVI